jgi:hypothetical protein
MEQQYGNNSIQSTVQLAVALGRLHDLASQVVNVSPRERDDTNSVSREAFNRLQDNLEQIEQQFGIPRLPEQESQGRQRGQQELESQGRQRAQERQSQSGGRDTH